jgi:hypothetical protein
MSRRIAGIALAGTLFLTGFLVGCGKDNPTGIGGGPHPPPYVVTSIPELVLFDLWKAYASRDSVMYDSLFDDAYQGTSIDQTDHNPTALNFTKADEHAHIVALAKDSQITLINVTPAPSATRFRDNADPPGWETIQNPLASLEIRGTAADQIVSGSLEIMQFKFVPKTPAPGSPTDTTWKIIRWSEVKTGT